MVSHSGIAYSEKKYRDKKRYPFFSVPPSEFHSCLDLLRLTLVEKVLLGIPVLSLVTS